MDYVLTCACGVEHIVSKSQADKQIECQCGESVRIPTLRGFKDLPIAESTPGPDSGVSSASNWRGWKGIVFSACLALALFAAYKASIYLLTWATFNTAYSTEDFIAEGQEALDTYGPDELIQAWDQFEKFDMRVKNRPSFMIDNQFAKENLIKSGISGGVILVLGAICVGIWSTVPRKKKTKEKAS